VDFDLSGRPFAAGEKDATFCHACVRDKAGTLIPGARLPVFFGTTGPAQLAGDNTIMSEAGIATVLVDSDAANPQCAVYAVCLMNEEGSTRVLSAAASPDGAKVPAYKIHYTTDGTTPSTSSPVYSGPIRNVPGLRVAIVVNDQVVALGDLRTSAPATSDKAASLARSGDRE